MMMAMLLLGQADTAPDVYIDLLRGLTSNGPWAALAAWLLHKVITAWTDDRKEMTTVLSTIAPTLTRLDTTIGHLDDTMKKLDIRVEALEKR